jgi:CO dehydrogenase nickel-insertion accessory protein CooC1
LKAESIEIAGIIPYDTEVFEACLRGQSIKRGSALQAAGSILTHLMQPLSVVSQGDAHVS